MPTASGVEFVGFLAQDADSAFPIIRDRFDALGYTAFLFQESQMQVVRAVAGVIRPQPFNPWINLALFLLTVASTVFTGALYEGINPFEDPGGLLRGVPFAFTVMVILGTHEMGHYVVARRHKAAVSLPYFVPLPFISLFGTLGAVIVQRSPFENRKSLFDVGVAGPLAGLIVALPLLIFSLATSEIRPYSVEPGSIFEGNSLLYLGLKYLIHGKLLPYNGLDVYLSSMAFAAWFGLVITFFNLFPIGQLDGGHVLYALIGRRAWPIAVFLSRLLLIAGALGAAGEWSDNQWLAQNFFSGWLLWGILTTLMNPHHPPPLNDISRLDTKRKVLGIVVIILFFLLFTRIPLGTAPILF
jgi:membrane-associated protease RseP (regulator of RpoE activity)